MDKINKKALVGLIKIKKQLVLRLEKKIKEYKDDGHDNEINSSIDKLYSVLVDTLRDDIEILSDVVNLEEKIG